MEKLTSQLYKQDKVAASATTLATSLQQHKVRAGMYEDSLDSTAQGHAAGEVGSEPQTSASLACKTSYPPEAAFSLTWQSFVTRTWYELP
jgi:hypothetical protein